MVIPKYSSAFENHIEFGEMIKGVDLRMLHLEGIHVKVVLNPDKKFVYYNSNRELPEGKIEKYIELFNCLNEKFFYGETSIYMSECGEDLVVYDIYTNSNWLSERDMLKIQNDFKYIKLGFKVATPIQTRNDFDKIETIKFLVNNDYDLDNIYFLPTFYFDGSATYDKLFEDEDEDCLATDEKYIIGTKPAVTTTYYTGKVWNSKSDYSYSNPTPTDSPKKEVAETAKKKIKKSQILNFFTKEEREQIYKDSFKNVCDFVQRENIPVTNEEVLLIKTVCYFIGLITDVRSRAYFERFLISDCCCDDLTEMVFEFINKEFKNELKRTKSKLNLTVGFLNKFFKEEIVFFEYSLGLDDIL